jgi:hypothetical protein
MRSLGLGRYALRITVATAMLAGCGGSQPPIGAPGAVQQSHAAQNKPRPASGDALIYAFTNFFGPEGVIFDYPSGKLITTFQTPMAAAGGACSDAQGNVFLSGSVLVSGFFVPTIEEYTYGSTSPSASVSLSDVEGSAESCSVDDTTGNVAAIIYQSIGTDIVAVFPHFQGPPSKYGTGVQDPLSVGYDSSGNLFLLGFLNSYSVAYGLTELPRGGTGFSRVSLNLGKPVPVVRTVQWDGSYVTIEATYHPKHEKPKTWPQAVYRLSISGSNARVVDTILFAASKTEKPGSSWIQSSRNIMLLATGPLGIWKYPLGGKELKKIHLAVGSTYVATVASANSTRAVQP